MTANELAEAQRSARLIAGFIQGSLTEQEENELDEWVNRSDDHLLLFEKLTDDHNIPWAIQYFKNIDVAATFEKLEFRRQHTDQPRSIKKILPYLAAAIIIGVISLGVIYYQPFKQYPVITRNIDTNFIVPGSNKAILILANGERYNLDDQQNSILQIGGVKINNFQNTLSYPDHTAASVMNTLEVPTGGQYQLLLADGTKVWLNAASTLTYPTAFIGTQRDVHLSGEGYFEVAPDAQKPFIVNSGATRITVKGTHFNVRNYPDDPFQQVTLLEGAVDVSRGSHTQSLVPHQQANIDQLITVNKYSAVDMPWVKGKFSFDHTPISQVMQDIARWYNVAVQYDSKTTKLFTGEIYRHSSLADVLHMLELSGNIQFHIRGRTVIVHNP